MVMGAGAGAGAARFARVLRRPRPTIEQSKKAAAIPKSGIEAKQDFISTPVEPVVSTSSSIERKDRLNRVLNLGATTESGPSAFGEKLH